MGIIIQSSCNTAVRLRGKIKSMLLFHFTCHYPPPPEIFLEVYFMCIFSLAEHTILKIASSLGIHTDKVKLMYESVILEQETAFFPPKF